MNAISNHSTPDERPSKRSRTLGCCLVDGATHGYPAARTLRARRMAGGVHRSETGGVELQRMGEITEWLAHLVNRAPERFERLVREKCDTLIARTKEAR